MCTRLSYDDREFIRKWINGEVPVKVRVIDRHGSDHEQHGTDVLTVHEAVDRMARNTVVYLPWGVAYGKTEMRKLIRHLKSEVR